jgi:hypothetical protein
MALQLIGAGFGRTGTMSTWAALNALGLPCYHMVEVTRNRANKGHLDFWLDVSRAPGAQQDWERVFASYTAAVDFPASCVWRELMVHYPDAKVLLTVHPKGGDAWYDSVMETIYFTQDRWFFKVIGTVTPFGRKMREMCRRLIWERTLRGAMPDRAAAAAQYQRHIDEVVAGVPADRLLVFSANQGWGPLCAFLGLPVPETPFPNINDRADFTKMFTVMKVAAGGILAAGFVLVAALWYGLSRLIG